MGSGRRLLVLLALPAAAQLAASPVFAAAPERHFVALCKGGSEAAVLLPGPDPFAPEAPQKRSAHQLCAHAMCPRAEVLGRRARLPG